MSSPDRTLVHFDEPTTQLFDVAETTFAQVRQEGVTATRNIFDGKPELNFTWREGPISRAISVWLNGNQINFSVSAGQDKPLAVHSGATTVIERQAGEIPREQLREQLQNAYTHIRSWRR